MKKKILLISTITLLLCGCGEKPTLQNGEEAIVSFKDNQMLSVDSFYNEIKNTYGLDALVNMIDKYIYEIEFSDKKDEANDYADNYIEQLRTNYETDEQILSAIRYMSGTSYATIDAYKNVLYLSYLQNEAIMTYVENSLTEKELKDYYDNDVYPNMTISHIIITPDVSSDDDDVDAAEEEAKQKVEDIIKQLDEAKKNGEDIATKFAELAKEYSEDDSTKEKGGDLGEINIGSLGTPYDELIKEAAKLQDGEYSSKVITTQAGYHVILKTKTGEKQSYEDALSDIKETLANEKLTENSSLIVDAIKHYRDEYDLEILDSDLKSQYGIYMNNLINTYANANSNNN